MLTDHDDATREFAGESTAANFEDSVVRWLPTITWCGVDIGITIVEDQTDRQLIRTWRSAGIDITTI
jgi:hypothetical protein